MSPALGEPRFPPLVTITPFSLESMQPTLIGLPAQVGTAMSIDSYPDFQWSEANYIALIPFTLDEPATFVKMFALHHPTSVSGNCDIGIYDEKGTRLVSAGSTVQAVGLQEFDITDTTIGPGRFYLAYSLDNTTGQLTQAITYGFTELRMAGMRQVRFASFPLPATLTPGPVDYNVFPYIGATTRSLI